MFFKTTAQKFCGGVFLLLCLIAPAVFGGQVPDNVLDKIHFRSIGPTKQSGRFMQVGVPDTRKEPFTFYAAASTGGLWKTTDNGITYRPVFDDENINALGDVEVAFSDPEIVYVGTGNLSYWGEGMFKSTDGGQSWTHIGLKDSHFISKIVIHPENPDIVYVSAVGSPYDNNQERGIFKTSDGGTTWTKVLGLTANGKHVSGADVHMHPTDFNTLYASLWDRDGGEASGIFKTTDGGASWDKLGGGLPTAPLHRIGLDIYRSSPKIVVATILIPIANPENPRRDTENTIWRTRDGGKTWKRISPGLDFFEMRGANRYGQIRIDPNNEYKIFVLNNGIQGTDDGGKTWKHAIIRFGNDHQDLWINPHNSDHMIGSSDSGIRISFNGCKTWYHPDNLPCGLCEAVGVDMAYPYNVYGGMQDFGTWRGPNTKRGRYPIRFEDWEHVRGADGGYAQVDPRDNRWLFVSSQNGEISRNDQKTNVRKDIKYEKKGIRFNFVAPFLLSPHNPNVIFHGANVLLRSDNLGECWQEISPDLTNGPNQKPKKKINGTISTLDESPVVQGIIWVGTDDGNVQLTRDGGKSWTTLNDNIPGMPAYRVSRVEASRHDPAEGFVALNGRTITGDLKPYAYRTTNYGKTWVQITKGLPEDEPVNVIRHDPKNSDLIFLGTEKSAYVSLDRGDSWQSLRKNMPNIPVTDMVIHPRENDLIVATYGRSFWIADISPLQEINASVLDKDVHLFEVEPQVLWVLSGQKQVAANWQNYSGENAPKGIVVNYYLKNRAENGVAIRIFRGSQLVNEYLGSGNQGLNSVEWHLTERIPRTAKEREDTARWIEETRNEELFFDYYDGHDHFGEPDEEVSVTGRPLGIWIQPQPEWREAEYKHIRAKPGEYTVKLNINGKEHSKKALVLKDQWYEDRY